MQQSALDNEALRAASPALHACLSDLGRRVAFPPDIPFQAAEARGKAFNATIGQITRSDGRALALAAIEERLALDEPERHRALLYSPVQGHHDLRSAWRAWQRRDLDGAGSDTRSGLPIVTVGLTHALSLVADLFAGPGRTVAIPAPFWGNYRHTFATRTGAVVATAPAYVDGAANPLAIRQALGAVPAGEPALCVVNAPSNPGGYSPTTGERARLIESLAAAADERPLLVLCDDAYAGLVYESDVPRASVFWDLVGRHENLIPVKIDGATKEFGLFGGRVGFVTFPFAPEDPASLALESKIKGLTRATVGSPVSLGQILLLEALRTGDIEQQVEAVRRTVGRRYAVLRRALAGADPELLAPLPFNSGCFALVELPEELGLEAEAVRRHLLERHDTGLVSIGPRYLRIAYCSVDEDRLPELVARLERGVRELAGR